MGDYKDRLPGSPEWSSEEERAATILDDMLTRMSDAFVPSEGDPDQWINESRPIVYSVG